MGEDDLFVGVVVVSGGLVLDSFEGVEVAEGLDFLFDFDFHEGNVVLEVVQGMLAVVFEFGK